jgi:hypothetical protein
MHADFSVELGRDDPALELPWHSDDPQVRHFDLKTNPELIQMIPEAVAHPPLGAFLARINAAEFPLATAKCDAWQSREVSAEEEIFGDRKFVSYIDLVFVDEADQGSLEKHEAFVRELCRLLGHAPEIAATVELVIRRCYYRRKEPGELDSVRGMVGSAGAGKPCDGRMRYAADKQTSAAEAAGESTMPGEENNASIGQDKGDVERVDQSSRRDGARLKAAYADEGNREGERGEESVADEGSWEGVDESTSGFYVTAYVSGFGDAEHEARGRWEVALTLLQHALVQLARSHA